EAGFVDLGLDSISGVTWIRAINQTYGTAIEATRVYAHPTIESFTRYLQGLLAEQAIAAHEDAGAAIGVPVSDARPTADAPLASGWPPLSSWRPGPVTPAVTAATRPAAHPAEIAVIGMAGRFPMAADVDAFWDNLAAGRNCISEIPESRWDTRAYYVDGPAA